MSEMLGIREYRAALKRAPADMREQVFGAIKTTVDGVHGRAKGNIASMVKKRSGALDRNYRKYVSRQNLTGRVGYLSAAAAAKAFYARFVNDGTSQMPARPFHTNAVEAEKELDTARMVKARDDVIRKMTLGGRGSGRISEARANRILRPGRF